MKKLILVLIIAILISGCIDLADEKETEDGYWVNITGLEEYENREIEIVGNVSFFKGAILYVETINGTKPDMSQIWHSSGFQLTRLGVLLLSNETLELYNKTNATNNKILVVGTLETSHFCCHNCQCFSGPYLTNIKKIEILETLKLENATCNDTLETGSKIVSGNTIVTFGGIYESTSSGQQIYKAKFTVTNNNQTETKYLEEGVLDTVAGIEIYVNIIAVSQTADQKDSVKAFIFGLENSCVIQ